jgi:prepilin signal peptidase PulO-like enzyme (type II secretory pathway)
MIWLLVLFIFFIGAVVGSFVNVVIERTIAGEDWVKTRSRCDGCKKAIAWYDNIPLISFLLLSGKCRRCKRSISIQHPVVEGLTGLLFVWWYVMGFAFFQLTQEPLTVIQPLFWLAVGVLLLIVVIVDAKYMIIPDYAVVGLGLLALLYRVYLTYVGVMRLEDLWTAIISGVGAAAFFFFLWAGTKGRGMGFGDVKYALVMGWLVGWPRIMVGVLLAFIAGAVVGVLLLVLGRKKMKQAIPFGPFLVLGTVLALIFGGNLWGWYWNMM